MQPGLTETVPMTHAAVLFQHGVSFGRITAAQARGTWALRTEQDGREPGYLTNEPGSQLRLTWTPGNSSKTIQKATLALAYLQSYVPEMGAARMECVQGCACKAAVADSYIPSQKYSVARFSSVDVQMPPGASQCTLLLTALPGRQGAKSYKFKVLGWAVEVFEEAGAAAAAAASL